MSRRRADIAATIGAGLLVILLYAPLIADFQGLTYDEPVYAYVGERHARWLGRFLRFDRGALSVDALDEGWGNAGPTTANADWHPPLGKLIHAGARRLPLTGGGFARARAGSLILFALGGCLLVWWIGGAAGRAAGWGAAIVWWTLPRAVGHGCLTTLDMPAAVACLLASALTWRLLDQPTTRRGVALGLGIAAACLTKFNGVLPAVVAVIAGARRRGAWRPLAVGLLVVAPTVGWLGWPWLWYDGLTHLRQVLAFHGRHGYIGVEYFGVVYAETPPPWHYPVVMLALTTPPLVLLAAIAGGGARRTRPLAAFCGLSLLVGLLPFLSPAAAKYNGVRLFLPALPLVAALAGLGVAAGAEALRARFPAVARRRAAAPAALAILLAVPSLAGLMSVYPYPLAYYSPLIGGTSGANARGFEVTYWGEPLREALVWVSRNAAPGDRVRVHPPGFLSSLESYRGVVLREDLRLVGPDQPAEWIVYQNRRSEWDEAGRRLVAAYPPTWTVLADDAPAAFVWRVVPR